jgi:hypothetical protein
LCTGQAGLKADAGLADVGHGSPRNSRPRHPAFGTPDAGCTIKRQNRHRIRVFFTELLGFYSESFLGTILFLTYSILNYF